MSSKRIYRIDGERLMEIRDKIFGILDSLVEEVHERVEAAKKDVDTLFALLTDLSEYEASQKVARITEKQKKYLKYLYKRLGRNPPEDMDKWSRATASVVIDDLLKQVREVSKSD